MHNKNLFFYFHVFIVISLFFYFIIFKNTQSIELTKKTEMEVIKKDGLQFELETNIDNNTEKYYSFIMAIYKILKEQLKKLYKNKKNYELNYLFQISEYLILFIYFI